VWLSSLGKAQALLSGTDATGCSSKEACAGRVRLSCPYFLVLGGSCEFEHGSAAARVAIQVPTVFCDTVKIACSV
jgi:hypothetical protein